MKSSIPAGNVRFKKGLNQITGKTSEAKALPAFKAMLAEEIRRIYRAKCRVLTDEDLNRIIQENLESYRANDFEPGEVEKFQRCYRAMPRRGLRKNISKK